MYIRDAVAAEQNAADRMRELGFSDARITPAGADNGIDVVASSALAQVKWRGAQVPRADIQRLFGARGHRRDVSLLFFAASGFSKAAVECADELEVMLFSYDPDGTITPHGRHAAMQLNARPSPPMPKAEPTVVTSFPTAREGQEAGRWTALLGAIACILALVALVSAVVGIANGRLVQTVVDLLILACCALTIALAGRRLRRLHGKGLKPAPAAKSAGFGMGAAKRPGQWSAAGSNGTGSATSSNGTSSNGLNDGDRVVSETGPTKSTGFGIAAGKKRPGRS